MKMTVFSGMLVATIFGVLIIPALFVFINRITGAEKNRSAAAVPAHEEAYS